MTGALIAVAVAAAPAAAKQPSAQAQLELQREDPALREVAKLQLDKAAKALERARGARDAGDARGAELLTRLADDWLVVARDLGRARSAEEKTQSVGAELQALQTRMIRARALLEETVARRGRAQAQLEKLGGGAPGSRPSGVETRAPAKTREPGEAPSSASPPPRAPAPQPAATQPAATQPHQPTHPPRTREQHP